MHYLDYNEKIQHRTGDMPMAFYPVDVYHPRYQMTMHWHRETELIRVRKGWLDLYIDNRELRANRDDVVLIAEGVLHGGVPTDCEYDCLVFDAGLLLNVDACKRALRPALKASALFRREELCREEELRQSIARLFDHCQQGIPGREASVLGALYECFGAISRRERSDISLTLPTSHSSKSEQLKPALEYIEAHYSQPISLDTLARMTGMSPKYFCRFFRTIVHRSPIDYVNYYRVECASQLLSVSEMTVAEIAQHCGFNDSSFFIKQFRRYKGTTPKQYRAAMG